MSVPPETGPDARSRLLDAACAAFREDGYRVSIDRIATRAQVARQTLYNQFGSKDALFAEVVRRSIDSVLVTLDGDADLRSTLLAFGEAYRGKLLSPEGLAMFSTMSSEAPRFPELAAQFFREGPKTSRRRLAAYLARAMEAGTLRAGDADFAAEMLTAMLIDYDRLRGLFDTPPTLPDPAKTARVVDCFLLAFSPRPGSLPQGEKAAR